MGFLTDLSTNNFQASAFGGAGENVASINDTGSIAFFASGGNNKLSIGRSAPIADFGTGDFTIEWWEYLTITSGNIGIIMYGGNGQSGSTDQPVIGLRYENGDKFRVGYNTGSSVDLWVDFLMSSFNAADRLVLNTWVHCALVRSSGQLRFYRNGRSSSTVHSFGVNLPNAVSAFRTSNSTIGSFNGVSNGQYIDDLRITKGVARYTSFFTVPKNFQADSSDPHYNNVSLLLLMNGQNNSQTFIDSSINNYAISIVGNPRIVASQKKFGTSAVYFDGNGDYISIPNSQDFNLSSGDFTIEGWIYWMDTDTGGTIINKDGVANSSFPSYLVGIADNKLLIELGSGNGVSYIQRIIDPTNLEKNTWIHFAAVKSGSTVTLYKNGINVASATQTGTIIDGGKPVIIGYQTAQASSAYFTGYIDDLRITKGIARYTSNFTPPNSQFREPTDPYIDNVSLLLHGETYSSGSKVVIDSSNYDHKPTVIGAVNQSATFEKFGFSSIYFNTSGDRIELASSSAFEVESGDFTIEFWIRPNTVTSGTIISKGNIGSIGAEAWSLEWLSPGYLRFYAGNGSVYSSIITTATVLQTNTWYHIALVRENLVYKFFINGSFNSSMAGYPTGHSTGGILMVGSGTISPNTRTMTGYIDELRFTKGVARYSTNFIPHTAPFPSRVVEPIIPQYGLVARFKADDGVVISNNGIITQWVDQSGNDNNATAYNSPRLVLNQLNGRPAVSFDGTAYFRFSLKAGTTIASGSKRTYIIIGRYRNPTAAGQVGFLAAGRNGTFDLGYVFKNSGEDRGYFYQNATQIIAPNLTLGRYHIATVVHNGIDNYNFYRINGYMSTAKSYGTMSALSEINEFVICGRSPGSERFTGEIVEILIYNRELSFKEIEQIEKWANI